MKMFLVLMLLSVHSYVYAQTPRMTDIDNVNQRFLRSCAEAEKLFILAKKGDALAKGQLIDLVIGFETSLIFELEARSKGEVAKLRPSITCTRSVAIRVRDFIVSPEVKKKRNFKSFFPYGIP